MRAIILPIEADRGHPFIDQKGILSSDEMIVLADTAREDRFVKTAATTCPPGEQRRAGGLQQLELDRPARLALDDRGTVNLSASDNITDLRANDVTAAKLAVDGKVEQCTVAKAALMFQGGADRPDIIWLERLLGANKAPVILWPPTRKGRLVACVPLPVSCGLNGCGDTLRLRRAGLKESRAALTAADGMTAIEQ